MWGFEASPIATSRDNNDLRTVKILTSPSQWFIGRQQGWRLDRGIVCPAHPFPGVKSCQGLSRFHEKQ